jgi:serine/threonine-protein kinase
MPPTPDHDLLFGVTAAQLRFITNDQLLEATAGPSHAVADGAPPCSLREKLCELGMLTQAEADAVAAVVEQRLARFGHDAKKTLDSVGAVEPPAATPSTTPERQAPTVDDRFVTQAPRAWSCSAERPRFTVLRLHQQGGLGRLMVAQDTELNREIALKEILPAYADDENNRRRFIREAEITGALEHPGVVPVYSLGEFADGRPFYAMRLIRGVDLRTALDDFYSRAAGPNERGLEFRQLLGRFVDVCQAIHYAHSRGVIHRDIKPGNIMLGDFGETLVVDWGLAKPMDEPPSADEFDSAPVRPSDRASSDRTQAGRVVGTVQYMSPEQAAGRLDMISPASDIYGLGATLYHILTGRPPFEADGDDTVFRVQQGRFPVPRAVVKSVPRPLEAICLKAMARKPADRYSSARELAIDVERYLADERVSAYAEPVAARTWRWVRQHRTPVMSLMAAAVVAVVGLSLGVALLRVQRDRAEHNFQLAQDAVRNYYVRVSEETLLDQPGMQPLRDALLRQALAYYEQFVAERQDDRQLRREVAQAQYFVGRITETIDSPQKALPHYRQAAELEERLLADGGGNHGDPSLAVDHAQTLNAIGRALQNLELLDEARKYYHQAAALRETLAAAAPEDAERARALASSLMNLGQLQMIAGEPAAALPLLERAQSLRLAHATPDSPPSTAMQRDLGMGYFNLARAQLALGDASAGESRLMDAIGTFEALAERQSQDLENHRRLALCRRLVAGVKAAAGDADAAIDFYEQARDALEELERRNPDVPDYAADLAGVRMDLGDFLHAQGELRGALVEMSAAVDGLRKLVEREAAVPRRQRDLAVALRAAGEILGALDRRDEARGRLGESKSLLEQLVREHPTDAVYATELQLTAEALAVLDAI